MGKKKGYVPEWKKMRAKAYHEMDNFVNSFNKKYIVRLTKEQLDDLAYREGEKINALVHDSYNNGRSKI